MAGLVPGLRHVRNIFRRYSNEALQFLDVGAKQMLFGAVLRLWRSAASSSLRLDLFRYPGMCASLFAGTGARHFHPSTCQGRDGDLTSLTLPVGFDGPVPD
jgi:hypothetical protein